MIAVLDFAVEICQVIVKVFAHKYEIELSFLMQLPSSTLNLTSLVWFPLRPSHHLALHCPLNELRGRCKIIY